MLILGDDKETDIFPLINIGLIVITCCAFVYQIFCAGQNAIMVHGIVNSRFINNFGWMELSTLITSIFLHGGLMHLIGNLWYLYIFGDNVEEFFGHVNYFFFYFACGIIGSLVSIAYDPTLSLPSIGASGAIAGVLGAYLVLHPNAGIKTWWGDDTIIFCFRTYSIPAWVIIGIWFIIQYVCLYLRIPGIGWTDHIGGFAAGMVLALGYRALGNEPSSQPISVNTQANTSVNYLTTQPQPANMLRGGIAFILILATVGAAGWLFYANAVESKASTARSTTVNTDKVIASQSPPDNPKKVQSVSSNKKGARQSRTRNHSRMKRSQSHFKQTVNTSREPSGITQQSRTIALH